MPRLCKPEVAGSIPGRSTSEAVSGAASRRSSFLVVARGAAASDVDRLLEFEGPIFYSAETDMSIRYTDIEVTGVGSA